MQRLIDAYGRSVGWALDHSRLMLGLFFTTMATRGAITYAGAVEGDSVRFLKESKITGKKARIAYGFIPDPEMLTP